MSKEKIKNIIKKTLKKENIKFKPWYYAETLYINNNDMETIQLLFNNINDIIEIIKWDLFWNEDWKIELNCVYFKEKDILQLEIIIKNNNNKETIEIIRQYKYIWKDLKNIEK